MTLSDSHDETPEHLGKALHRLRRRTNAPLIVNADGETVFDPNVCWLYGSVTSFRYGQLMVDGDYDLAHRWAWRIYVGPIPKGRQVRHSCGEDRCWNPAHLTRSKGPKQRDPAVRAAAVVRITKAARDRSPLTWEAVDAIRASTATLAELSAEHGVSTSTIWKIRHNITWVREQQAVAA
ncbi:HNH endonuclease [Microbispora sp. NPDC049633]|uniref:HNH endonuclease n=1 Tax=Microbispora sp. NPDC049633 TaxID=3154355 RepID=UPI00343230DE